jgi:hypothetical protein
MLNIEQLKSLKESGKIHHTRQGTGCFRDSLKVYARDTNSPSGFNLLGYIDISPEVNAILNNNLSPLSPSEHA